MTGQPDTQAHLKKQVNQLMARLYDANLPLPLLKECWRDISDLGLIEAGFDQDALKEGTEGKTLDSDEEDELYEEVDAICTAQERAQELRIDVEFESARLWNSTAMKLVTVEQAYRTLYGIFSPSEVRGKTLDPEVPLENIAEGLLILGAQARHIDMDRILVEVARGIQHLECLVSEDWYKLRPTGIRMSALISASKTFRKALLDIPIFDSLCKFNSFPVSLLFSESESRLLLEGCKIVKKSKGEVLYDQSQSGHWVNNWYILIEGQVSVARIQNEVQLEACQASEGVVFGAYSSLQKVYEQGHKGRQPVFRTSSFSSTTTAQQPLAIKITASRPCVLIQMRIAGLEEVCSHKKISSVLSSSRKRVSIMKKEMLEAQHRKISSSIRPTDFDLFSPNGKARNQLTEMNRKLVVDSIALVEKTWASISQGANTVPRATFDEIKVLLGEGGTQAFMDVFKPMYAENAPTEFRAETFWYCWTQFLSETCLDEVHGMNYASLESFNDISNAPGPNVDDSTHGQLPPGLMLSTDISIFEEHESFQDRLLAYACRLFPWAFADHRISLGFLAKPIGELETSFFRVTGSLTDPLQGEHIRQYLKLVMVEFPYPISLENCREFCELFDKKFEKNTKISYQEVVFSLCLSLSIYLSIYLSIHLSPPPPLPIFLSLSVSLSLALSIPPSVSLFYLSISLSFSPSRSLCARVCMYIYKHWCMHTCACVCTYRLFDKYRRSSVLKVSTLRSALASLSVRVSTQTLYWYSGSVSSCVLSLSIILSPSQCAFVSCPTHPSRASGRCTQTPLPILLWVCMSHFH